MREVSKPGTSRLKKTLEQANEENPTRLLLHRFVGHRHLAYVRIGRRIPPIQYCQSSCVSAERFGDEYYVVARGRAGGILAVDRVGGLEIPQSVIDDMNSQFAGLASNRAIIVSSKSDQKSLVAKSSNGTRVETNVEHYETPTHWVTVITTIVYDKTTGEVLDVEVTVQKIKKPNAEITDGGGKN